MLKKLRVHGFRTLVHTEIEFSPLTIMIGKNGVGKTALLDVIQVMGKFARGGAERAFGPPPWSLGWQKAKGIGTVNSVDFDAVVQARTSKEYRYELKLDERRAKVKVEEERLTELAHSTSIAAYNYRHPPASGTILNPDEGASHLEEIRSVAEIFEAFESYELNPSSIERSNDPKHDYVSRDGYGVAGYLANLKDTNLIAFTELERRLRIFRPETDSIKIYSTGGGDLVWGIQDAHQDELIPAVHLSWGDRQLVGLLCVLFQTQPGSTIAIEEIDRGFHPSRFDEVIELLTESAHEGILGGKFQVVITTHSPSFISKMRDRTNEIVVITRSPSGSTIAKPLDEVIAKNIGGLDETQTLGEVWESGLLEDIIKESLN